MRPHLTGSAEAEWKALTSVRAGSVADPDPRSGGYPVVQRWMPPVRRREFRRERETLQEKSAGARSKILPKRTVKIRVFAGQKNMNVTFAFAFRVARH